VEENGRKTRFQKGNPGGPGRPRGSYVDKLKHIRDDDGDAILAAVVKAAKKGNITAARLIIERTEGLPVQPIEHGGSIQITVKHV
jgi:hypothetical protein